MPTLTSYRQFCAYEAGRFYAGSVKSSGNSTTTAIVNALISSLSTDDIVADYWLYFPTAAADDKIRTVKSFTAATGTLTVDRAYSASTIPNSKSFELHGVVCPYADTLTELSWTTLINDALKRVFLEDEITITPTANAIRHEVTTANSWLTEAFQVRQVGYLSSSEARAEVDPYIGRTVYGQAEKIKNLLYIAHRGRTFQTNETIYVKVVRSAYDLIQAAGAGAFGAQSGLALETDVAIPSVERVGYAALVNLAKRQGLNLAEETKTRIKEQQQEWAAQFTDYTRKEGKALPELTFRPSNRVYSYRHAPGH